MKHTLRGLPPDRRDLEIQRLKGQLEEARQQVGRVRAEERERFSLLSAASKRFADSMRSRMDGRQRQQRRLDAQHAVSRVLEDSGDLSEAAPEVFRVFGERLGWEVGVLWTVEEGALRCGGIWRSSGMAPNGFEEACRGSVFRRGACLPGRVWRREEACWVADVLEDDGFLREEAAAAARLRCALAFLIQDGGRLVGVFELLKAEVSPVDEDLVRVAHLVGHQIGQFVERRRAERDRDRALAREREARQRIGGILESINDTFFALNHEFRFTYLNERAEAFFGKPRREVLGCAMSEAFPEAGGSMAYESIAEALRSGEPASFEAITPVTGAWISARVYPTSDGASVFFEDIGERKRAEERLRESEERFRLMADAVPQIVWLTDPDGRVEFFNRQMTVYTGAPYKPATAAEVVADHVHPDDVAATMEAFEEARRTGETLLVEHRIRSKSGDHRWFLVRADPYRDPRSGEIVRWFGASVDIHDRKVAEAALRRNEERWRALIDKGSDVITISDRDGTIRFVSPSIEAVCGFTVEEFVGSDPFELGYIHPDDLERCREVLRDLAANPGRSVTIEHRFRHKTQGWRWLEGTFTALFHDPAIGGLVANFRDVTERKEAEEALRENDEWLRLAQRYAGSGTWEWDLRTDEIRWSDEHRDLFGFEPSDEPIEREDWWAVVHPEDLPRIEEAGRRCLQNNEEWPEIEYRIFRDGEVRWIAARGRTERDEGGRAVRILGISVDATRRKETEEERDRLLVREWVASAEVAERERISRELHDRVAHSMGVAHQSLELYEVLAKKDAARATAKLKLAGEMTKTALESTRNLSAELRRMDAEEGLESELRHLLEVAVPSGIRSGIRVNGDEAGVPGHVRGQIFLVLREAVRNAVSHSGCGSISVDLDIAPERLVGSVEDDGRGFEAANGNGGVGLRSMRERAALLDGALRLDCGPGRGTRVEVSVPLTGRR